jgi:hypothetical protein
VKLSERETVDPYTEFKRWKVLRYDPDTSIYTIVPDEGYPPSIRDLVRVTKREMIAATGYFFSEGDVIEFGPLKVLS